MKLETSDRVVKTLHFPIVKYLILYNLLFSLFFSACNNTRIESKNVAVDSSIIPLKITIDKLSRNRNILNGQYIEVTGKFIYQFEDVALYDAFPNSDIKFWLGFDNTIEESKLRILSGKIVTIKGIIDTKHRGHLGAYLGTISNIYFIKEE